MYILYGIPNCDSVKKATDWLRLHQIDFQFHDYKKEGVATPRLKSWVAQVGITVLLNKKSNTWRALDPSIQDTVNKPAAAIALLAKNPTLIKRPVLEFNGKILQVGFAESDYAKQFNIKKKPIANS